LHNETQYWGDKHTTVGRISQYWWFNLFLTGLAIEEFQPARSVFGKKMVQDASGDQKPTLLSSLWSGLFIIISGLMIIAAVKITLTW